jgi:WXXGXW repeat (2 copies)
MKTIRTTALATLALALLLPGVSFTQDAIVSDTAPPAPRIEHPPAHRDGFVWAPGFWEKSGRSFRWVSGTWINERRGVHWVADRWEQTGNEWRYVRGHWEP